jgi:hypothetical protein
MIDALRRENPQRTLVVDGGDCFQGGAVAALSKGQAITPLINRVRYDLVLPGNWEVVYGKAMLIKNMKAYAAAKVCANMFHSGTADASPIFPPYQIFDRGGIRVGFVGYNDPLTPRRQSPAYSRGITFTQPERDLAYGGDRIPRAALPRVADSRGARRRHRRTCGPALSGRRNELQVSVNPSRQGTTDRSYKAIGEG